MFGAYISPKLHEHLVKKAKPVTECEGLFQTVESAAPAEATETLQFLVNLTRTVKGELASVLERRQADRKFLDERMKAMATFNNEFKRQWTEGDYKTVMGLEDGDGRVVVGPKGDKSPYFQAAGDPVAPLPDHLKGKHVTLFGTPDTADICLDAMNCFHCKLPNEPSIVGELVEGSNLSPFWGADSEDSKTPLREGLLDTNTHLNACFNGTIKNSKGEGLQSSRLAQPIKRLPGLPLPSLWHLIAEEVPTYGDEEGTVTKHEAVPLHIYDFVLHFLANWENPKALTFYFPKIENEEEAAYLKKFFSAAEDLLLDSVPQAKGSYVKGTIRVILVLENPRAIFRANEIMDELYPYFAGASLGWHDFLASTARLFKDEPNYRLPVKADSEIVVRAIKASHELLANVVGTRGGIKIGGMYGVLPVPPSAPVESKSFQITLRGFFRDLITQLKRGLDGFWVAEPPFARIGIAIATAWEKHVAGDTAPFERLVNGMLHEDSDRQFVMNWLTGKGIEGVPTYSELYPRFLIAADKGESTVIANNDPEEIRYNCFQTLQYLADWLGGVGCVALPALISDTPVLVLDDLATCERSRWEVWLEIAHNRFPVEELVLILHQEMLFIRKDFSNEKKIVHVKYTEESAKWYQVAFNLLLRFMTDTVPVEFVTESLLIFTLPEVRSAADPWDAACQIDPPLRRAPFSE